MQVRESVHHEKALDSELEGTEHDKRKREKENDYYKEETQEATEPRERGRKEETERTWVALFWVEICFGEKIY